MGQVSRTAKHVNGIARRVKIWALQYFAKLTIDRVTDLKLADYGPARHLGKDQFVLNYGL